MVSQASEEIARQFFNANLNKRTWGEIAYVVSAFGIVGDGVTNVTANLQALINLAISENRKTIFFPQGQYYVTSLTNADQVYLLGDNASFVGGYTGTIDQFGGYSAQLADMAINIDSKRINALYPPAPLSPVKVDGTDTSAQINAILTYAKTNGIPTVYIPETIHISSPVIVEGVILEGCYPHPTIVGTGAIDVVQFKGVRGAGLRNVWITANTSAVGININPDHISSGVADFIVDHCHIENALWGMKTYFCWNGSIRNSRIISSVNGIQLGSQSNQIDITTIAIKATDIVMEIVNSAAVKIQTSELTQYGSTKGDYPIRISGASSNAIVFDSNYLEGLIETGTILNITTGSGQVQNVVFENNTSSNNVAYLAYVSNLSGFVVRNNVFPNLPSLFSGFFGVCNDFKIENNAPDNFGLQEYNCGNIACNTDLSIWAAGTSTYPTNYTQQGATLPTISRDTDGSLLLTGLADDNGVRIDCMAVYCQYVTVDFYAKSSVATTITVALTVNGSDTTVLLSLPTSTAYKRHRAIIPTNGVVSKLIFRLYLTTANVNLKNVMVIPSLYALDKHSNRHYGGASPTHSSWYVGDEMVNNAPTAVKAIDRWRCITSGTPGTWRATGVGSGTTANRPTLGANDAGYVYRDTTTNALVYWSGSAWL